MFTQDMIFEMTFSSEFTVTLLTLESLNPIMAIEVIQQRSLVKVKLFTTFPLTVILFGSLELYII